MEESIIKMTFSGFCVSRCPFYWNSTCPRYFKNWLHCFSALPELLDNIFSCRFSSMTYLSDKFISFVVHFSCSCSRLFSFYNISSLSELLDKFDCVLVIVLYVACVLLFAHQFHIFPRPNPFP